MSRPTKSVVPAGVKGMTRRIGRVESPCAKAGMGKAAPSESAPRLRRVIMILPPKGSIRAKVAREARQINPLVAGFGFPDSSPMMDGVHGRRVKWSF